MHKICFNSFNVDKQIIENNILTQRRLIDKNKRDFWLKCRRNFLRKKNRKKFSKKKRVCLIYLKNINVKIVKHNPTEDNNNPINVIIERICSTNLGVLFCSISFKEKK